MTKRENLNNISILINQLGGEMNWLSFSFRNDGAEALNIIEQVEKQYNNLFKELKKLNELLKGEQDND